MRHKIFLTIYAIIGVRETTKSGQNPCTWRECVCIGTATDRYRNRENLSYCKERGIRLSGPTLGRPKKGEERNKAQDYWDECERVEVERKFSLGKRKCGMGLVTTKLEETAAHVVALSILLLNLRKIQCAFLQFWDWLLGFLQSREKRWLFSRH